MIARICVLGTLLIGTFCCSSPAGPPERVSREGPAEVADRFQQTPPLREAEVIIWCNPIPTCTASGNAQGIEASAFSSVSQLAEVLAAASLKGPVALVVVSERVPSPPSPEEEQFLSSIIFAVTAPQCSGCFFYLLARMQESCSAA